MRSNGEDVRYTHARTDTSTRHEKLSDIYFKRETSLYVPTKSPELEPWFTSGYKQSDNKIFEVWRVK